MGHGIVGGIPCYERRLLYHLSHAHEIRCESEIFTWKALAVAYPVLSWVEGIRGLFASGSAGGD